MIDGAGYILVTIRKKTGHMTYAVEPECIFMNKIHPGRQRKLSLAC